MRVESLRLAETLDASMAVGGFLDAFTRLERAQALHLVLKQLRQRTEPDRVLACELATMPPIGPPKRRSSNVRAVWVFA